MCFVIARMMINLVKSMFKFWKTDEKFYTKPIKLAKKNSLLAKLMDDRKTKLPNLLPSTSH